MRLIVAPRRAMLLAVVAMTRGMLLVVESELAAARLKTAPPAMRTTHLFVAGLQACANYAHARQRVEVSGIGRSRPRLDARSRRAYTREDQSDNGRLAPV